MKWDGEERRHPSLINKLDSSPTLRWSVTVVLSLIFGGIGGAFGLYITFNTLVTNVGNLMDTVEKLESNLSSINAVATSNSQFRLEYHDDKIPDRVTALETRIEGQNLMIVQFVEMQRELEKKIDGTNARLDMVLLELAKLHRDSK